VLTPYYFSVSEEPSDHSFATENSEPPCPAPVIRRARFRSNTAVVGYDKRRNDRRLRTGKFQGGRILIPGIVYSCPQSSCQKITPVHKFPCRDRGRRQVNLAMSQSFLNGFRRSEHIANVDLSNLESRLKRRVARRRTARFGCRTLVTGRERALVDRLRSEGRRSSIGGMPAARRKSLRL